MKDHVESKLQAGNIDTTRTNRGLKVQRLHKDFLARFLEDIQEMEKAASKNGNHRRRNGG